MSAMPDNIVPFELPKKPRIKQQEAPPDMRRMSVLPIRAIADRQISDAAFRALALICSYTNRAGITWVSQKTLAQAMNVSQQAISKHLVKLQALGYVEVMKKHFRGKASTTWRVIFDPSIDAETAIAVTSSIEDTRPPFMKHEQDNAINQAGQQRIAQLLARALKGTHQEKLHAMSRTNPQGDTITTRKMKQEIAEHQAKRKRKQAGQAVDNQQPFTTSEVVAHSQPGELPTTTSRVVRNEENDVYQLEASNLAIDNLEKKLKAISKVEIADALKHLREAYAAEGLQPPADPDRLAAELEALHNATKGLV